MVYNIVFIEDIQHFFNVDDFAVAALINGITVYGLLESSVLTVHHVHCYPFKFTCAEVAISHIQPEDEIKINDQAYRILAIQPDGTGLVRLLLELLP